MKSTGAGSCKRAIPRHEAQVEAQPMSENSGQRRPPPRTEAERARDASTGTSDLRRDGRPSLPESRAVFAIRFPGRERRVA
jgi:hypothetical protein